jgi:hypothetical protein
MNDTVRHTQKRTVAKGFKVQRFPDHTHVVLRLEDELFDLIRSRAITDRTSFNEQARMLLEWGLDAASESA